MVKRRFVVLTVLFAVIRLIISGYCDFNSNHLLCGDKRKPECGKISKYVSVDPSDLEIKEILEVHNMFRDFIASGRGIGGNFKYFPKASNMEELVWDRELSALSQVKVKTCSSVASCGECTTVERFWWVGENLLTMTFSSLVFEAPYRMKKIGWKNLIKRFTVYEAQNFNVNDVSFLSYRKNRLGKDINKFARITNSIWAKTTRIGCARIAFEVIPNITYDLYAACHYGPGASYKEYEVYKIGDPCTSCPGVGRNCSYLYSYLCTADGRNDFEPPKEIVPDLSSTPFQWRPKVEIFGLPFLSTIYRFYM